MSSIDPSILQNIRAPQIQPITPERVLSLQGAMEERDTRAVQKQAEQLKMLSNLAAQYVTAKNPAIKPMLYRNFLAQSKKLQLLEPQDLAQFPAEPTPEVDAHLQALAQASGYEIEDLKRQIAEAQLAGEKGQEARAAAGEARAVELHGQTMADKAKPPADPNEGKTIETDQGIMLWNPETNRYDIPSGNKPASKSDNLTFEEATFEDFAKNDALTKQYGKDRIGFRKWQLDQEVEKSNRTRTPKEPRNMDTLASTIAARYDSNDITKNYAVVKQALDFVNSLTPSSTDDQGLIYAFAKAMDPNSVVRETEYATVQKYAQSLADAYGFKAARIFSNSPFLTQDARRQLISTIKKKGMAAETSYKRLRDETAKKLKDIGESPDVWLNDYGTVGGGGASDDPASLSIDEIFKRLAK